MSGSISLDLEDLFAPLFDLVVVFVYVPKDVRVERIKKRSVERFGKEALPGGGRYEAEKEFIEWAASYDTGTNTGRNLQKHEKWLGSVFKPTKHRKNA